VRTRPRHQCRVAQPRDGVIRMLLGARGPALLSRYVVQLPRLQRLHGRADLGCHEDARLLRDRSHTQRQRRDDPLSAQARLSVSCRSGRRPCGIGVTIPLAAWLPGCMHVALKGCARM
jgi:hypothetical protein